MMMMTVVIIIVVVIIIINLYEYVAVAVSYDEAILSKGDWVGGGGGA